MENQLVLDMIGRLNQSLAQWAKTFPLVPLRDTEAQLILDYLREKRTEIYRTDPQEDLLFFLWLQQGELFVDDQEEEPTIVSPEILRQIREFLAYVEPVEATHAFMCLAFTFSGEGGINLYSVHENDLRFMRGSYLSTEVHVSMTGSGDSYSGTAFDLGELITGNESSIPDFEAFLDNLSAHYMDCDSSVNFNNEGGEFRLDIRLGSFFVTTEWTDYEYEEDEYEDEEYEEVEEEEENASGETPPAVKVGGESVEFEDEEEEEDDDI